MSSDVSAPLRSRSHPRAPGSLKPLNHSTDGALLNEVGIQRRVIFP